MVNEWSEFLQYTGPITYAASGKRDVRFLGRFTWDTLLDFEGLARVLTVLARGFLFHHPDGSLTDDPRSRIEYARRAPSAVRLVQRTVPAGRRVKKGLAVSDRFPRPSR